MADSREMTVDISFAQEFEALDDWRAENLRQLRLFETWLRTHDLADDHVVGRLDALAARMRAARLMVAFIAEFSRGKSELINAIFFAGMGRRIMPASAGRTTMCPVEIGYDARYAPSLRLLPLSTREQPLSMADWRERRDDSVWVELPIDPENPAQVAETMLRIVQTQRVSRERAELLGFWNDERPEENPSLDEEGKVEVPMWRHAIVNFPHPLLKRGLVILDTPGLNAVGAEPELTLALLPQAHALLFVLAADAGVTRSDLDIWHEYFSGVNGGGDRPRYVLLNKIDTLWDGLLSKEQQEAQLARQCDQCAQLLGIPRQQILPLSAQKGLVGKLRSDERLLQASRLLQVERVLASDILPCRRQILEQALLAGLGALRRDVGRQISARHRELVDQLADLRSLQGKNTGMVQLMLRRVENERREFNDLLARVLAVRSVMSRQFDRLSALMSHPAIDGDLESLRNVALDPGMRVTLSGKLAEVFDVLRIRARAGEAASRELREMLQGSFDRLNADGGFTLSMPQWPGIGNLVVDLDFIEERHARFFGVGQAWRLRRLPYAQQLLQALTSRVRSAFDDALGALEQWSGNALHAMEVQLKERRSGINRRTESLEKVRNAGGSLDQRITEIAERQASLRRLEGEFDEQIRALAATSGVQQVRPVVIGSRAA